MRSKALGPFTVCIGRVHQEQNTVGHWDRKLVTSGYWLGCMARREHSGVSLCSKSCCKDYLAPALETD